MAQAMTQPQQGEKGKKGAKGAPQQMMYRYPQMPIMHGGEHCFFLSLAGDDFVISLQVGGVLST
jgi:hypothetical protein